MPGSIALVGSGEYLPAMAGLEKSLIDDALALGKKPTYIQIPTAAGRESQDRLDYWRALGKAQADKLGSNKSFFRSITVKAHSIPSLQISSTTRH